MKIGIASDHRGYEMKDYLKKYLKNEGYIIIDYGADSTKSSDYPIYGFKLGEAIAKKEVDKGIAICGTGIGIGIAMNKVKGVICAKVSSKKEGSLASEHNHANSISLSGDMSKIKAKSIIKAYLKGIELTEEKYVRRIKEITDYEDKKC